MIEVEQLTKRYGTFTAIESVSFSAKSGEIVGLLGPNGAGKTTTMRILTGYMPPSSGSARVAGYDVYQQSLAVREKVGYLPERVPIYPDMTVQNFIGFWADLRGVKNKRQRVQSVLEQFDLTDRRNQLMRSLSKGLRQRVGLAQAIVHNPPVVILDEPTIGIDPQQVIEVRQFVRQLKENHTVLFSSHILSEVEQVCDRVVIIHKGRVVAEGTTEMLSQQLQPGMHIFVIIDGATSQEVMNWLKSLPHIASVQKRDKGYLLTSDTDQDIRPFVAQAIAERGLQLLEMRPVEITLENVFLSIINKG